MFQMQIHTAIKLKQAWVISQDQNNNTLSSEAFACLQHGFLRTVENVNIYNFVTPKWCMEKYFLNNIDTFYVL